MLEPLAQGVLHGAAAMGLFMGGRMLSEALPVSDQTPITLGLMIAVMGGAFVLGVGINNIRRDIAEMKRSIRRIEDEQAEAKNGQNPHTHHRGI